MMMMMIMILAAKELWLILQFDLLAVKVKYSSASARITIYLVKVS